MISTVSFSYRSLVASTSIYRSTPGRSYPGISSIGFWTKPVDQINSLHSISIPSIVLLSKYNSAASSLSATSKRKGAVLLLDACFTFVFPCASVSASVESSLRLRRTTSAPKIRRCCCFVLSMSSTCFSTISP